MSDSFDGTDKIEFTMADQTAVEALSSYVDDVLEALAEALDEPDIVSAFVSDESTVSCFLTSRRIKGTREMPDPFKPGETMSVNVVDFDTPENEFVVSRLRAKLKVDVGIYDRIYEVAIRLRKLDET